MVVRTKSATRAFCTMFEVSAKLQLRSSYHAFRSYRCNARNSLVKVTRQNPLVRVTNTLGVNLQTQLTKVNNHTKESLKRLSKHDILSKKDCYSK